MAHRRLPEARTARLLSLAVIAACLLGSGAPPAKDPPRAASTRLWRLDCGTLEIGNLDDYSDTFQYRGRTKLLTDSCYLIGHGDRYLLWDTGLPGEIAGRRTREGRDEMALRTRIRDQLARLRVTPEQITFVGISHYHFDHIGQARDFPKATLLVDRRDWDAIKSRKDRSDRFTPWINGGTVETLMYDHDVFGDGKVLMLSTPGHTPGHRSLLVRLDRRGPILLSGDVVHFAESWQRRTIPAFNTSRAESLASIERLSQIAHNLKAELIIQHEPGDIRKLPPFPQAAD